MKYLDTPLSIKTETIWKDFSNQLYAYILKKVRQEASAQDILQEVFIKVHLKKDTLRDHQKLVSWLYQLTNNSIIDYFRKNHTTELAVDTLPDQKDGDETNKNNYGTLPNCVEPFMGELSEHEKQLIEWVDLEGRKQKDIAQELDIPYPTLKSQLQRARKKLKHVFLACCTFTFDRRGSLLEYQKRQEPCNDC